MATDGDKAAIGIAGERFVAVLGIGQSPLEAVLLKRRIMGPSWVSVSKPNRVDAASQARLHRQNASQIAMLASS